MKSTVQATRDLIAEVLTEHGMEGNDLLTTQLNAAVSLDRGPVDPDAERGPTVTRDSDGKVIAEDWSIHKILNVDLRDIAELGLGGAAILNIPMDQRLKVALAIGGLLLKFWKKGDVSYEGTDAHLLLALHPLQEKPFTHEELRTAYRNEFGAAVDETAFGRSLTLLQSVGILQFRDGKFKVRKKITVKYGWSSVAF